MHCRVRRFGVGRRWGDPVSCRDGRCGDRGERHGRLVEATTAAHLRARTVSEDYTRTMLTASEGFTRPGPVALVVAGYGVAFYCLSLVLRSIPVGVAYAVWSGLGIVLITLAAWWFYGQRIDTAGQETVIPAIEGRARNTEFLQRAPRRQMRLLDSDSSAFELGAVLTRMLPRSESETARRVRQVGEFDAAATADARARTAEAGQSAESLDVQHRHRGSPGARGGRRL